MSVSRSYTNDPQNVRHVLSVYQAPDRPTLGETARRAGTTFQNVQWIITHHLPAEKIKAEKALRYSRSKTGAKNPMKGRNGSLHHNFKGDILSKDGYLIRKVQVSPYASMYVPVQRLVMAEMLGLEMLPAWLEVHHIDEDKTNNSPDNLALVTSTGHQTLHTLLRGKTPRSQRSTLWEQWESGTSRSTEPTPT